MVFAHVANDDPGVFAKKVASHINTLILDCMHRKGGCVLGLVGGRSIALVLSALGEEIVVSQSLHQGALTLVWLDERLDHQKNFFLALPFIEQLANAGVRVEPHPILALDETQAHQEIASCTHTLSHLRGSFVIDVALLSVGEDGHVASLFPNHLVLNNSRPEYVCIDDSPKLPKARVTVTVPVIQSADAVVLLFVGKEKREVHKLFCLPTTLPHLCPATFFRDHPGLFVASCFPRR